jgi:hypothetical protein
MRTTPKFSNNFILNNSNNRSVSQDLQMKMYYNFLKNKLFRDISTEKILVKDLNGTNSLPRKNTFVIKNKKQLTILELLCVKILRKKETYLSTLEKVEMYVKKKSSLEYMIKKFNEIDKLKFMLLKNEELEIFNLIQNPHLKTLSGETKNLIQSLWKKFEFQKDLDQKECDRLLGLINKMDSTSLLAMSMIELI